MEHKAVSLQLPSLVVGPVDIGRLVREIDAINDSLAQLKLRKSGDSVKLPKTTQLMDSLLTLNKLNLLHEHDRVTLTNFLNAVMNQAPVIHMSFSADASPAFLDKLMAYLRREIHPLLLLTLGLEPIVGAGCILRTTNRYFDLSLKQDFINKRQLLVDKLVPAAPSVSVEARP